METIKISQESLDAFKKEKKMMPAPIDEKNVTSDWIECVFDNETCIWGKGKCAVGFIHEQPVMAAWSGNTMLWKFMEEQTIEDTDHLAVLKDRLRRCTDPESDLTETFNVVGNMLMQKFYWKDVD